MEPFKGFLSSKLRFTRVPTPFFKELLPQIDDLGELKVTLYFLWHAEHAEGRFQYLRLQDFQNDQTFFQNFPNAEALKQGLARAVQRGSLLSATIAIDGKEETFYILNTLPGQAAAKALSEGKWHPSDDDEKMPISLDLERPNIFSLYEEHIGPLSPMIAEALTDAEKEYNSEWIEEAIRQAVENNVRRWNYVKAILERWQKEGKHARRDQEDTQEDREKYFKGKYTDSLE